LKESGRQLQSRRRIDPVLDERAVEPDQHDVTAALDVTSPPDRTHVSSRVTLLASAPGLARESLPKGRASLFLDERTSSDRVRCGVSHGVLEARYSGYACSGKSFAHLW
jgi:hypothetical protein